MRLAKLHIAISGVIGCLCASTALAQATPPEALRQFEKEAASCANMRWQDFSLTEDAPASIAESQIVSDTKTPYCQVDGVVSGKTRFTARFPLSNWNGKMVVVGTGGQAGTIMTDAQYVRMGGLSDLVGRGYAFIAHDAGHVGAKSGVDTLWGLNNRDAMIDYGFRGAHASALIGKEIVRRFYGRPAKNSYYHSCSNGGREGMILAQRYPWDFDGIIAAAPSMSYGNQVAGMSWLGQQMQDQSRNGLDTIALLALHKSVLAQCDKLDGLSDGILNDPRKCKVSFTQVRCKGAQTNDCLTDHQISIAQRVYEGARTEDGAQIASATVVPGAELSLIRTGAKYASVEGTLYWFLNRYAADMLRDLAFDPAPGPGWEPDPSKLAEYRKRMGLMDSLFSATNPDMRAYKNRGGKLLIYMGWNDVIGGVRTPMDYYENVERMMGAKKSTQDFFRLFMMPGMDHCTGGEGAYIFDYLGEMEKWVETGKSPEVLTGYHPKPDGKPEFYRSIKPYKSSKAN